MEASGRRLQGVANVLRRPGRLAEELGFTGGDETAQFLRACRILVIGAGGLGCEILKNLALSGFADIHVIDMDTIDVSNLNRQFLFRSEDVGKSKAEVAAAYVNARVRGVRVVPHFAKIQDFDQDFYMQFGIVVCGLDSVEARRWMSATLVGMVDSDIPESLKPLIDGGTEGFKGQARVILPTITSCYECSLDMLGQAVKYPICTIANTPRLPEHCIEWASMMEWPREMPEQKLDTDNPEHIEWLRARAEARARKFNITGVTYSLTQGVVKNIIPAIASTNAIIAASCCNEAFKIATSCNPYLENYMMYTGERGVYTYTFPHQKRPDCPVCGEMSHSLTADARWTLQDLIERLQDDPDIRLRAPSLRTATKSLYLQAPPPLEQATRKNLACTLAELISSGDEVAVTDAQLPISLRLRVELATGND